MPVQSSTNHFRAPIQGNIQFFLAEELQKYLLKKTVGGALDDAFFAIYYGTIRSIVDDPSNVPGFFYGAPSQQGGMTLTEIVVRRRLLAEAHLPPMWLRDP